MKWLRQWTRRSFQGRDGLPEWSCRRTAGPQAAADTGRSRSRQQGRMSMRFPFQGAGQRACAAVALGLCCPAQAGMQLADPGGRVRERGRNGGNSWPCCNACRCTAPAPVSATPAPAAPRRAPPPARPLSRHRARTRKPPGHPASGSSTPLRWGRCRCAAAPGAARAMRLVKHPPGARHDPSPASDHAALPAAGTGSLLDERPA